MAESRLSVVQPVRNEARFLGRTLHALLDQSLAQDDYELLVVDGGSADRTAALAAELAAGRPCIRVLENPGRLSSAGRNGALRI